MPAWTAPRIRPKGLIRLLLSCGTWYVVEALQGGLLGCGGFLFRRETEEDEVRRFFRVCADLAETVGTLEDARALGGDLGDGRDLDPVFFSELQKLGFAVSETTVSRYFRRFRVRNPDPGVREDIGRGVKPHSVPESQLRQISARSVWLISLTPT